MVRFKPIPSPPSALSELEPIHRSIPLVPAPEADCLRRLRSRAGIQNREEGRAWLGFLRAVELAVLTERGYRRLHREPTAAYLREPFRRRVYGAAETLSTLQAADRALSGREIATRTESALPTWERRRNVDPAVAWRDRTERLLEWAVLLGIIERVPDTPLESDESSQFPEYWLTDGGTSRTQQTFYRTDRTYPP